MEMVVGDEKQGWSLLEWARENGTCSEHRQHVVDTAVEAVEQLEVGTVAEAVERQEVDTVAKAVEPHNLT
jgi:hypothetical protein